MKPLSERDENLNFATMKYGFITTGRNEATL